MELQVQRQCVQMKSIEVDFRMCYRPKGPSHESDQLVPHDRQQGLGLLCSPALRHPKKCQEKIWLYSAMKIFCFENMSSTKMGRLKPQTRVKIL
jgi:hypothetical protein